MQILLLDESPSRQVALVGAFSALGAQVIATDRIGAAAAMAQDACFDLLILLETVGGRLSHKVLLAAAHRNSAVKAVLLTDRTGAEVDELFSLLPGLICIVGSGCATEDIVELARPLFAPPPRRAKASPGRVGNDLGWSLGPAMGSVADDPDDEALALEVPWAAAPAPAAVEPPAQDRAQAEPRRMKADLRVEVPAPPPQASDFHAGLGAPAPDRPAQAPRQVAPPATAPKTAGSRLRRGKVEPILFASARATPKAEGPAQATPPEPAGGRPVTPKLRAPLTATRDAPPPPKPGDAQARTMSALFRAHARAQSNTGQGDTGQKAASRLAKPAHPPSAPAPAGPALGPAWDRALGAGKAKAVPVQAQHGHRTRAVRSLLDEGIAAPGERPEMREPVTPATAETKRAGGPFSEVRPARMTLGGIEEPVPAQRRMAAPFGS